MSATREYDRKSLLGRGEGRRVEVVLVTRTVEGKIRDWVVVVRGLEVDKGSLIEVKGRVHELLHDDFKLIVREVLQTLGKNGIIEGHEAFLDHLKAWVIKGIHEEGGRAHAQEENHHGTTQDHPHVLVFYPRCLKLLRFCRGELLVVVSAPCGSLIALRDLFFILKCNIATLALLHIPLSSP